MTLVLDSITRIESGVQLRNPNPIPNRIQLLRDISRRPGPPADFSTRLEMSNMQQTGGPSAILNKCRELNDAITELRTKREGQLATAQSSLLDSATGKEDQIARQNVDYIEDEINTALRYLRDQFKRIKETPGSGDPRVSGQVENVNRNLRREIEQYQRTQSDFRKRLEEQVRRRYEIANPEATPEELEQGVQNVLAGQEQAFMVGLTSLHLKL